jgi:hypothetical protein
MREGLALSMGQAVNVDAAKPVGKADVTSLRQEHSLVYETPQ